MPFATGQSGNPRGRPPGIATQAKLREVISKDLPDILETLVYHARRGDVAAAKLLLDRVLPPLKPVEEPVVLPLGEGLAESGRETIKALGAGRITPDQATKVMGSLGTLGRIVEMDELLHRIEALEERVSDAKS